MPEKDDKDLQKEGDEVFKRANFANALSIIKENYKTYVEQIILYSSLRKAKYDSLQKVGFTTEEAMEIITKVNLLE